MFKPARLLETQEVTILSLQVVFLIQPGKLPNLVKCTGILERETHLIELSKQWIALQYQY